MTTKTEEQSLTSKIIKILRVTSEPLSAHAISDAYRLNYSKVKQILSSLEEDGLIYSLKTPRGKFFFLPDKYFKRKKDFIESDEIPPYIWYEELTDIELNNRKEKILAQIKRLKDLYKGKDITADDFFKKFQGKNEELSIINQIIEDRTEKRVKLCFHCKNKLSSIEKICPDCEKEHPICPVCKRAIFGNENLVKCSECNIIAHDAHMKEWLKSFGECPNCYKRILEDNLIKLTEGK
ncbi:MAG: hypothetical protein FK730_02560 [Asgard group archaeon]|nr:hypothetical protein [Asgard group archaeon]